MDLESLEFLSSAEGDIRALFANPPEADTVDDRQFGAVAAQLLSGLLTVIQPIRKGTAVQVDGITLRINRSAPPAPGNYEAAKTFTGIEPALVLIGSLFSDLLASFVFTWHGDPVEVDGFRVRQVDSWAKYPLTALEAVGPISSYCNARCLFCYEQGSKLPFNARFLSVAEAEDRLTHYDVGRGQGLPIGNTFSLEALCNPAAVNILKAVRRRNPYELIKITTHGSNLTDETIRSLAQLKPIILVVSLNTVSADGRRELMADHHPEIALAALPKLRDAGIPFVGSVVPWPTLSLADVEATIRYFDSYQARMIRVSLPSYTRHFRPEDMFDTDEVWTEIVSRVLEVRPQLTAPINMMPTAYWNQDNRPLVEGTYRGSPADGAGLKVGDLLLRIEGQPVFLRHQAKRILERHCASGSPVNLTLLRGNAILEFRLRPVASEREDLYPYKPESYRIPQDAFGIFFSDGFKLSYVQEVASILDRHHAKNSVIFASKLIQPIFQATAQLSPDFGSAAESSNLQIRTAPCNYWGGNVVLGDLNVVEDFEVAIDELLDHSSVRPDLIILPGTFLNHRGFDLRGAHYKELGRHRIPVEIVGCDVMMK